MHTDDTQEPQDFPVEARKLEGTVQEMTAITPSWSASVSVSSPEGQYWDASVGAPENLPSTPADLGRAVYSAAVAVVTALGPEASLAFQRAALGSGAGES